MTRLAKCLEPRREAIEANSVNAVRNETTQQTATLGVHTKTSVPRVLGCPLAASVHFVYQRPPSIPVLIRVAG